MRDEYPINIRMGDGRDMTCLVVPSPQSKSHVVDCSPWASSRNATQAAFLSTDGPPAPVPKQVNSRPVQGLLR